MEFALGNSVLRAMPSGAMWWQFQRLLCVSDLHLGKSERMARRAGALLPPYEVAETLSKLEGDIARLAPRTVICLGDSFDDLLAGAGLSEDARLRLTVCQGGREWIWIEGNHDAGPMNLGGVHLAEYTLSGTVFRHIAARTLPEGTSEVSGHYHPKARLGGQSLPAFLLDRARLIMPAFGAYTGGLLAERAPLSEIMHTEARALVIQAGRVLQMPMPRS